MTTVRTLLTSVDYQLVGDLVDLTGVFSRLRTLPSELAIYVELVKAPYQSGIGIDLKLSKAGTEIWRWGEELVELVAGDTIVVLACRAEGLEVSKGPHVLDVILDGAVAVSRMIYLGSQRGTK